MKFPPHPFIVAQKDDNESIFTHKTLLQLYWKFWGCLKLMRFKFLSCNDYNILKLSLRQHIYHAFTVEGNGCTMSYITFR